MNIMIYFYTVCFTLFIFLFSQILKSADSLYTVPRGDMDWHKIDPAHLQCPSFFHWATSECKTEKDINIKFLRKDFGLYLRQEGHTCTARKLITRSYTGFFGDITLSYHMIPQVPSQFECRRMYEIYRDGGIEYSEQLNYPIYKNSWLRTIDESRLSLLIQGDVVSNYDPYTGRLVSSIFPGGECSPSGSLQYCYTIHQETLWFSDESIKKTCDIFEEGRGKAYISGDSTCGISDTFSYHRSLNGSCQMDFCGYSGIRFIDGYWMSTTELNITLEQCEKGLLISSHPISLDIAEEETLFINNYMRSQCLETIESIMSHGLISNRRLSYLRKLTPGFGFAYRLINGSLEESITTYLFIKSWREILPNSTCLLINQRCYEHTDGIYFNGIISSSLGEVLIPDQQILGSLYTAELLISNIVKLQHPAMKVISDHISALNVTAAKSAVDEYRSTINFGLSPLWNLITSTVIYIILFVVGIILLKIVVSHALRFILKKEKGGIELFERNQQTKREYNKKDESPVVRYKKGHVSSDEGKITIEISPEKGRRWEDLKE